MKQRIEYIDAAKGLAVLFVIIGHVGLLYTSAFEGGMPNIVVHFAFTFHLPVFFIASGYFFRVSTPLNTAFFKKKFITLLLPYLCAAAIIVLLCTATAHTHDASYSSELIRWTQASLYGAGSVTPNMIVSVERIGGIWFLWALFWAQILVILANRLPKPFLWICGLFLLGWLSCDYAFLPLSIQPGLCAAFFFYLGVLAKKYDVFNLSLARSRYALAASVIVWAVYLFGPFGNMGLATCSFPSGFFDVFASSCAAYVVLCLCKLLCEKSSTLTRPFTLMGRYSLVIFCMHIVEDNAFVALYLQLIPTLPNYFGAGSWLILLAIRGLVVALLCGLIYVIPVLSDIFIKQTYAKQLKAREN